MAVTNVSVAAERRRVRRLRREPRSSNRDGSDKHVDSHMCPQACDVGGIDLRPAA